VYYGTEVPTFQTTLHLLSAGQSSFSCMHNGCLYPPFCWRKVVYPKRRNIHKNHLPSVFSTSVVRGNNLPRVDESKCAVFARRQEENYVTTSILATTIISVSCTWLEQVFQSIYISERLIYPTYTKRQRRNLEVSTVTFRFLCHGEIANWQSEGKREVA
jgi:hypothetical protein